MKFKITFLFFLAVIVTQGSQAQTKKPVAVKKPVHAAASPLKAALVRGKLVYTTYCMACHQANGGGVPNMNPPLIKTTYVAGDKVKLSKVVLKGFSQPVPINGDYYSNVMPAFDYLKDQEIADVLTYVRNNFGNKYPQVTALNVKAARK